MTAQFQFFQSLPHKKADFVKKKPAEHGVINCHSILCTYLTWEKTKHGIDVIFYMVNGLTNYICRVPPNAALHPPFCSHLHCQRPHLAFFWSYLIICLPPIIVMHLTIPENNQVLEWTLDKCRKVISLLLQMRSIFTPSNLPFRKRLNLNTFLRCPQDNSLSRLCHKNLEMRVQTSGATTPLLDNETSVLIDVIPPEMIHLRFQEQI